MSIESRFCEFCTLLGQNASGVYCQSNELNRPGRTMLTADEDTPIAELEVHIDNCSVKGATESKPEDFEIPLVERDDLALSKLMWLLTTHAGLQLDKIQNGVNHTGSSHITGDSLVSVIDTYLRLKNSRRRTRLVEKLSKKQQRMGAIRHTTNPAETVLNTHPSAELRKIKDLLESELLDELFLTNNSSYDHRTVGNTQRPGMRVQLQEWLQQLIGQKYIFIEVHQSIKGVTTLLENSIANKLFKPGKHTPNLNLITQPCLFLDASLSEEELIASIVSQLCLLIKFVKREGENGQTQCAFWNGLSRELQEILLIGADKHADNPELIGINNKILELLTLQHGAYTFVSQNQTPRKKRKVNQQVERPSLWTRDNHDRVKRMVFLLLYSAKKQEPLIPPNGGNFLRNSKASEVSYRFS